MTDTAFAVGNQFEVEMTRQLWSQLARDGCNPTLGQPMMEIGIEERKKAVCKILELRDNCKVLVSVQRIEEQ